MHDHLFYQLEPGAGSTTVVMSDRTSGDQRGLIEGATKE
jgi:hypothetical protein